MHSVRLEPTKLILTGTRTTYQATGDAGTYVYLLFMSLVFARSAGELCTRTLDGERPPQSSGTWHYKL